MKGRPLQWRIQDFPEEGAPTPQGGANIRFCQIFPKTAWNWKNLDPGRARVPRTPLRSATALHEITFQRVDIDEWQTVFSHMTSMWLNIVAF